MTEEKTSERATQLERDVVVVGAGFAGLYMLHKVRRIGLSALLFEADRASAAPGSGTAIPARVATFAAWNIPTPSAPSCSRNGTGPRNSPRSRKFFSTSITSPIVSICAATSAWSRASSCLMPAASTCTGGNATRSPRAVTSGFA